MRPTRIAFLLVFRYSQWINTFRVSGGTTDPAPPALVKSRIAQHCHRWKTPGITL
jgi:hypothetical protein